PNGRMAYGIEIGEHACVVADGNIVSANAAANGSYQNYIITRQGTCRSYVRGLQLTPSVRDSTLPDVGIAPGSMITDGSIGATWYFNGISWVRVGERMMPAHSCGLATKCDSVAITPRII